MGQKWLVVVLLCCVLLSLAWAAPKRNKDKKRDRQGRREQQQQPEDPMTEPEPQPEPDTTGTPSEQDPMEEEDADPKCSPWTWSECQPHEGECGRGIKLGVRVGEECKKTEKEKPCTLRCKGSGGRRKGGKAQKQTQGQEEDADPRCTPWEFSECEPTEGECGPGVKMGTRAGPECKKTEKEKDCRVLCEGEEVTGGGGGGRKKGKKQKQAQNQRGRPQTEEEEDADPRCTPWSFSQCEALEGECGAGVKIGTRSGPKCKKTQKEKDCRVPCGGGKKKGGGRQRQKDEPRPYDEDEEEEVEVKGKNGKRICKYRRGDWSECDEASNTQTRTMILKKGDEETCPKERYITKPCDRIQRKMERTLDCRYGAGDWGLCNTTSGMRMRVDILEDKGMEIEGCRTQRIVYKKCALACDYEYTEWSSCDPVSDTRRLEGTLVRTEDTPPDCEQTVMKTKPCFGRNGREKCFFGPWSEYSGCLNGYKYRIRELVAGGRKCELQASHAAKCKEKEMKE